MIKNMAALKIQPLQFHSGNIVTESMTNKAEGSTEMTETGRSDNANICQFCGKQIPLSNMSLHEVRCERDKMQVQGYITSNFAESVNNSSGKKKVKKGGTAKKNGKTGNLGVLSGRQEGKKSSNDKNNEKSENTENLDDLLAEFKRKDSQCALHDCKKSVLTLGQKCLHCSNVYCLGHRFPEVHGCTQAAKEQARSATSAPKQISQKATIKRGHLERKLENKIKDMETKRGNKNKNEKK